MRKIAKVLVLIGALNWGLIGVGMLIHSHSSWNIVDMILGGAPLLEAIVYVLVGLSAIKLFFCKCKACRAEKMTENSSKRM